MISEMAMEDIRALEKNGVRLSVEEIVKLNALGVKVEQHPNASSFYSIPRCAFLGDGDNLIVFREPTIEQEMWFENAMRIYNTDDETTLFLIRAFSMRMGEELPDWNKPKKVKKQIQDFIEKDLKGFTARQILSSVNYCIYGSDFTVDEMPYSDLKPTEEDIERADEISNVVGVIHDAQAMRLGISMSDMKSMTKSELQSVIDRALERDGVDIRKNNRTASVADYYKTLEHIKKKYEEAVKDNG